MYKCKNGCGKTYTQYTNLRRHYKTCNHNPEIKIRDKELISTMNVMKQEFTNTVKQQITEMNTQMQEKISAVKQEISVMAKTPTTQNINIMNINITKKLPSGGPRAFYDQIIGKLGHKKGMDVVASLAGENDPVGIYKILFPSNKMSENPIIYQNKVFRFLSDDDEVQIGDSVISRVTKHVKAAMLYASNDIIEYCMTKNNTRQLYEHYSLKEIQGNALKEKFIEQEIINHIKHNLIHK